MICPYCNEKNVLTWKRYWKNPTGKHDCLGCNKKFKLAFTIKYLFLILLPIMMLTAISIILSANYLGKDLACIGIFPALIISFYIDKYYDENYRKTIRLKP